MSQQQQQRKRKIVELDDYDSYFEAVHPTVVATTPSSSRPAAPTEKKKKRRRTATIQKDTKDSRSLDQTTKILGSSGTSLAFSDPILYNRDPSLTKDAKDTLLSNLDVPTVNIFPQDHPNLVLPGFSYPRSIYADSVLIEDFISDGDNDDEEMEPITMKRIHVPQLPTEKVGDNLAETQARIDNSYENLALKAMSETTYQTAQKRILASLQVNLSKHEQFKGDMASIYESLHNQYGGRLESMLNEASLEETKRHRRLQKQQYKQQQQQQSTATTPVTSFEGSLFARVLDSERIPVLKRKDVVVDFLRGPVLDAGERPCINGIHCISHIQFEQSYSKNPLLFNKTWKLKLNEKTGHLMNAQKQEFRGFALREFLCPDVETKRKSDFSLHMAKKLKTTFANATTSTIIASTVREADSQSDLIAWLSETVNAINPSMAGYCILCIVRLRSELTATCSSASIISNPCAHLVVQHHINVFGEPGEYHSKCAINRGSNICGLVGDALEYNVNNYLPSTATVHYKTLELAKSKSGSESNNNTITTAAEYGIVERSISVLQWCEIDDIVIKATDTLLNGTNNSMQPQLSSL